MVMTDNFVSVWSIVELQLKLRVVWDKEVHIEIKKEKTKELIVEPYQHITFQHQFE